jgi:trigger factor
MHVLKKELRFQLIEGRAMAQSDIKITFEDLKHLLQKTSANGKFGQTNPTDRSSRNCCKSFVKPRRSKKRLSDQVVAEKLLNIQKKQTPTTKG